MKQGIHCGNINKTITLSLGLLVLLCVGLLVFDFPFDIFLAKDQLVDFEALAESNETKTAFVNPTITIAKGSSSASNVKNFVPDILNVSVGTTVNWTNGDLIHYKSFELEQIHTVTSGNIETEQIGQEFDSGFLSAGQSFQHLFNSTGTFDYFCFIHPFMTGKIVVS